jgi:hypothetical protein
MSKELESLLTPVYKLNRDMIKGMRQSGGGVTDTEARFLVDLFYSMQKQRIRTNNQSKGLDRDAKKAGNEPEPHDAINWTLTQFDTLEGQIERILRVYVEQHPMAWFFAATVGIGTGILAAGLLAHIDISKAPTAGHIWRFAGLDPTITWEKKTRRPWNATLKTLCVIPGQRVLTRRGYVPIETVYVGDEVLTHLGRWKPVTQVILNEYDGTVVSIRGAGRGDLGPTVTDNHPIITKPNSVIQYESGTRGSRWKSRRTTSRQRSYVRAEEMRLLANSGMSQRAIAKQFGVSESCVSVNVRNLHNTIPKVLDLCWARADCVQLGWDIFYPRVPHLSEPLIYDMGDITGAIVINEHSVSAEGRWPGVPCPRAVEMTRMLEIDETAAYFLGLFIAEGHTSENNIGLSFHIDETEYQSAAKDFMESLGLTVQVATNTEGNSAQVLTTSKLFANWLRDQVGCGAWNKHIPMEWVERMNDRTLRSLLNGIFDGDGYADGSGLMLTTVSTELAYSVAVAIEKLGDIASVAHYDAWKVRWRPANASHVVGEFVTASYVSGNHKSKYVGAVYNLEVADDHSYVCEGVAVHNCWKIGDSFCKVSGRPDAYYGRIYRERKVYEWERNVSGGNTETAARELGKKAFGDATDARAWLTGQCDAWKVKMALDAGETPTPKACCAVNGNGTAMLPPAQIDARARRYAVKLFLSHLQESWWRQETGAEPPAPWIISHGGHAHKISPPQRRPVKESA